MWRLIRWSFRPLSPSNSPEPSTGRLVRSERSCSPLSHTPPLRHAKPLHPTSQFRPRRPLACNNSKYGSGVIKLLTCRRRGGRRRRMRRGFSLVVHVLDLLLRCRRLELRIGPLTTMGGSGDVRWHPSALLAWTQRVYFTAPPSCSPVDSSVLPQHILHSVSSPSRHQARQYPVQNKYFRSSFSSSRLPPSVNYLPSAL